MCETWIAIRVQGAVAPDSSALLPRWKPSTTRLGRPEAIACLIGQPCWIDPTTNTGTLEEPGVGLLPCTNTFKNFFLLLMFFTSAHVGEKIEALKKRKSEERKDLLGSSFVIMP